MKRKILTALMFVLLLFLISGCSTKSGFVNGVTYSTNNGDKPPIDIGDVTLSYNLQQSDTTGINSIPVVAELTNNTSVTLTDSYYITFGCVDGSTGNLSYNGSIQPGQKISMNGFLVPKTAGYVYKVDDLKFSSILTGYDPNDEQHCAMTYNFSSGVYEWDYSKIE